MRAVIALLMLVVASLSISNAVFAQRAVHREQSPATAATAPVEAAVEPITAGPTGDFRM